ncbi:unnamed protein product [Medioppia subpectinata]|uniref:Arf-GAP domain-containing protein n=1 Tax=Medioppia subpectinata TaxID=1979941 RepID=A0A7R9LAG0_9ACAR|nr:unnamed protein product [Medioppia subpectinata]CAG2116760.1 unnamed protein product [Medioppia subpectinata]
MAKQLIGSAQDVCADCGANEPNWVSLNRGVLVCDDCCLIHRSLGRHISQVKSIAKSVWRSTQIQMIAELQRSGSNSIWEHTLLDPLTGKTAIRRKPSAKDPIHPNKSEFIRSKYQNLSFINRSTNKEESETDISEQLHSSVRTPNLKTSLRLLASGADLLVIKFFV